MINYKMIVGVTVLFLVLLSSCTPQKVTCNSPYIQVGTSCCLDQNNNNICDKDESLTQNLKSNESTQTSTDVITEQTSSTIKVLSPNGGEKLIRGVIHKIRWSIISAPISKEVDIEIFKTGTCGAGQSCSLSRIASRVSGGTYDWVAGSDTHGNRLNYDSYMIVIRPSSDRNIKSDTSDAGFLFVDQSLFSIAEVYGLKNTYKPGEKISISFKGVESDGTPTSQEEGFGAQIAMNDGQKSQIVNGVYDANSGLWKAELIAPLNSGSYDFGYGVYCSPDHTYCKRYSIEGQGQVMKTLKITVSS